MSSSTDVPEPDVPTVLEVIEDDNWLWEPGEIIAVPLGRPATIDDLRRTKLEAEISNGELLVVGPSSHRPARAAGKILISLHMHMERLGGGEAFGARLAYIRDLPTGGRSAPMSAGVRASVTTLTCPAALRHSRWRFAIPERQGDEAERRMAAKRAD